MTRSTIGGPLGLAELSRLAGDPEHERAKARQIASLNHQPSLPPRGADEKAEAEKNAPPMMELTRERDPIRLVKSHRRNP